MSVEHDTRHDEPEHRDPQVTRLRGHAVANAVRELIHEGNTRRILIRNGAGRTVARIPVTAGVVAAVAAPVATAVGTIVALVGKWSIRVEQHEPPGSAARRDDG